MTRHVDFIEYNDDNPPPYYESIYNLSVKRKSSTVAKSEHKT